MAKNVIYLPVFYFLFALTACLSLTQNEMPKEELLNRLLREKPDSLAILLEEKINSGALSDSDKANYALWLIKTHQKQNRSLMNDTLIRYAVEYYKKTASPRLLDASMLAAEQINWSGAALAQQKQMLNETLLIAMQQKDTATVQNICFQLTSLYEIPKDSSKMTELIQITKRYAGQEWRVADYFKIVNQFAVLNQLDSVIFFARKGIELARKTVHSDQEQNNPFNNQFFEYQMTRFYANALSDSKKNEEAITVLRELEHSKLPVGNELQMNYIKAWINWGKLDSAQVYINSLQSLIDENKNKVDARNIIEFEEVKQLLAIFQEIIRAKEGKSFSIKKIGIYADHILNEARIKVKIEKEQQLVQTRLIQNNLMLDIEHGKLKQRFLLAGIIILLAVAIIIFIYQRKLLRKERSVREAKEQLRLNTIELTENEAAIRKNEELINSLSTQLDESGDLKQEIAQLNEENEILKGKNKTLQIDMDEYSKLMGQKDSDFDVFEKLAEQNAKLQERERFLTSQLIARTEILDRLSKRPRYIEKSHWDEIIHAVNQLFDGYSYRLHTYFPTLTEEDIFYCCLFKLRLSTSITGILMGISPSSVTKRKQRIKEKMIQQHPDESRSEQLLEIYSWN